MADAAVTQQTRALLMEDIADDFILNSAYEIENALLVLNSLDSKVKWFKDLKRARNQELDIEVKFVEDRQQRLRAVILRTMKELEPDRKTLHFPSVGKVSRRQAQDSWFIEDEEKFLAWADARGFRKQVCQTKETLNSREAKKIITELSKSEKVPGTIKKEGLESISISISLESDVDASTQSKKSAPNLRLNLDDLDSLTESDV